MCAPSIFVKKMLKANKNEDIADQGGEKNAIRIRITGLIFVQMRDTTT